MSDFSFNGAKVALFLGDELLVYQRDDIATIPYPGAWDFPGGGREEDETPEETVIRETWEEFGLILKPTDLTYARVYVPEPGASVWFFAAHIGSDRQKEIRFGTEGQRWALWQPEQFLTHIGAVPMLQDRLRTYLHNLHQ